MAMVACGYGGLTPVFVLLNISVISQ